MEDEPGSGSRAGPVLPVAGSRAPPSKVLCVSVRQLQLYRACGLGRQKVGRRRREKARVSVRVRPFPSVSVVTWMGVEREPGSLAQPCQGTDS